MGGRSRRTRRSLEPVGKRLANRRCWVMLADVFLRANESAMTKVAVSYYVDDSYYANVGRGTARRSLRVYWRNIAVMLATARQRLPPDAELLVFTNSTPPSQVQTALEALSVRILDIGFGQPYPPSFNLRYRGAFHMLDVVHWFADHLADDELGLIVDPDCIWVRDARELLEQLVRDRTLFYCIDAPPDRNIQGITRKDLSRMFSEIDDAFLPPEPPMWVGGELCGFVGSTARTASELIATVTSRNLTRWRQGKETLKTEEHVLSYVFARMGATNNASDHLARIWTGPWFRNVTEDIRDNEFELTIWHLPGEKKRGLYRLFHEVEDPNSNLWKLDGDELRTHLARRVGIIQGPVRRLDAMVRPSLIHMRHLLGLRRGREVVMHRHKRSAHTR